MPGPDQSPPAAPQFLHSEGHGPRRRARPARPHGAESWGRGCPCWRGRLPARPPEAARGPGSSPGIQQVVSVGAQPLCPSPCVSSCRFRGLPVLSSLTAPTSPELFGTVNEEGPPWGLTRQGKEEAAAAREERPSGTEPLHQAGSPSASDSLSSAPSAAGQSCGLTPRQSPGFRRQRACPSRPCSSARWPKHLSWVCVGGGGASQHVDAETCPSVGPTELDHSGTKRNQSRPY